jgi:hypothetical protein
MEKTLAYYKVCPFSVNYESVMSFTADPRYASFFKETIVTNFSIFSNVHLHKGLEQGILKGEVSLYH